MSDINFIKNRLRAVSPKKKQKLVEEKQAETVNESEEFSARDNRIVDAILAKLKDISKNAAKVKREHVVAHAKDKMIGTGHTDILELLVKESHSMMALLNYILRNRG